MYDPVLGRWFSQDPAYQLINPYLFCGNDPINYIDPDGEWFFSFIFPGIGTVIDAVLWSVTGAYLGGVAANDRNWNPGQWDWSSKKTWGGIFGGAIQGFFTGAAFNFAMQPLLGSASYMKGTGKFLKVVNWTQTVAFGTSVATSAASMVTHSRTAADIILGQFYYDGSKSVGEQMWQAVSRRLWEPMQQWLGYNISNIRNTAGQVDNVEFLDGRMLVNDNKPNEGSWGVTLGNTINSKNIKVGDEMFMHEFGHTIQGKRWGPLYFLTISPASLISCMGDNKKHSRRWYEKQANRLANDYFSPQVWDREKYPFENSGGVFQ